LTFPTHLRNYTTLNPFNGLFLGQPG